VHHVRTATIGGHGAIRRDDRLRVSIKAVERLESPALSVTAWSIGDFASKSHRIRELRLLIPVVPVEPVAKRALDASSRS